MVYPMNDNKYFTFTIATVQNLGDRWYVASCNGRHAAYYFKSANRPIPKVDDECRVYGKGGDDVRGLFVDGRRVFYRNLRNQQRWIKRKHQVRPLRIVVDNTRIAKRQ